MFFYGIGNAMTDYFFDAARLAERDILPLEPGRAVHLGCDEFTRVLARFDAARQTGGTVFNALKTARLFGASAHFSGSCGALPARDEDAAFFQAAAGRCGVSTRLATHGLSSGRCLVVRAAFGTAVAASPGSAAIIGADQFEEEAARRADCVLVEGTQCGNAALMRRVMDFCIAAKKNLALLCATPYGAEQTASFLAGKDVSSCPLVFVFANRREGETAGGAARALTRRVFVQTSGAEGGEVWLPGEGAPLRYAAARPPAPVIDETGAGDVFAGAFLALWFRQKEHHASCMTRDAAAEICAGAAQAAAAVITAPLCDITTVLRHVRAPLINVTLRRDFHS